MKASPVSNGARHRLMKGGVSSEARHNPRIWVGMWDVAEARRAWAIGAIVVFLILCAGIAISEWYAYNVNVPKYQAKGRL